MDNFSNIFNKEPEFKCPVCKTQLHTDWVDIGFGAYSQQVSPYVCENCGWSEVGCDSCIFDKCFSWGRCQGKALRKSEYVGKKCTECGVEITPENDNGDGLCTKCMYHAIQDNC